MSQTSNDAPATAAPLTNPFSGPAADWLENVKRRIGVERQRLSRLEGKIDSLRPGALRNDRKENADYEAAINEAATLELKLKRLEAEERDALAAVEKERQAAAAAAKEKKWADARALGEALKAQAARVDAALAEAAKATNEARETVRQLFVQAPETRMWIVPGDLTARVENALVFACAGRFGGKFRSMTAMSELTLSKMTVASGAGEAVDAYLWREPNAKQ